MTSANATRLPRRQRGLALAAALIVIGIGCLGGAAYAGLHSVTRSFPEGVQVSSEVTSCGSVVRPRTPPETFSFVSPGRLPPRFPLTECGAARRPSLVWTSVLLGCAAATLATAVVLLAVGRRPLLDAPS